MDTVDDGFSETVDCPRDPVALTENFASSWEVNEVIDVCPSPAVDGLIVRHLHSTFFRIFYRWHELCPIVVVKGLVIHLRKPA